MPRVDKQLQMKLADHVEQLAHDHLIRIIYRNGRARAWSDGLIRIKPVTGPVTYFVALHEIGHIATDGFSRDGERLNDESRAWEWALDNSLIEPSEADMRRIRTRLESYVSAAARPGSKYKLPGPDSHFARFAKVIDLNVDAIVNDTIVRREERQKTYREERVSLGRYDEVKVGDTWTMGRVTPAYMVGCPVRIKSKRVTNTGAEIEVTVLEDRRRFKKNATVRVRPSQLGERVSGSIYK